MKTYIGTFSMYGTFEIEADTKEEALKLANQDLINWTGFGLDFNDLNVDGTTTEIEETAK